MTKRTVDYDGYRFTYDYEAKEYGYRIKPRNGLANVFFVADLDKADDILTSIHRAKRHLNE